jgi:hypothetical protein
MTMPCRYIIATGATAAALGITLYSQLDWVADLSASSSALIGAAVVLSFGLTFGRIPAVLVGGIMFARREPFGRSFGLSLALATLALCLMYLRDSRPGRDLDYCPAG